MTAIIATFPRRRPAPESTSQELALAWREAGHQFLFAAFSGATKAQLNRLAADLFAARDAMRKGWEVRS